MCREGPRCGDGVVQMDDEQCDDGDNDGGYGECAAGCRLGPRCGDGTVNGPEQCDDGNSQVGDGCSPTCLRERTGAR
jgi:cysteine-rich repeat protein